MMPEEALMLLPPAAAARSRRMTGEPARRAEKEAVRPARPAPTTMTGCCIAGAAVVAVVVDEPGPVVPLALAVVVPRCVRI